VPRTHTFDGERRAADRSRQETRVASRINRRLFELLRETLMAVHVIEARYQSIGQTYRSAGDPASSTCHVTLTNNHGSMTEPIDATTIGLYALY
jgi:hypothetical protein